MRPPMGGGSFTGRGERDGGGGRDSHPELKEKDKDPTSKLCLDMSDLRIERDGGGGRPDKEKDKADPTSKICSAMSDLRIERIGTTQWISVYTKRAPVKQRYHYNVTDIRLHHHVEKGHKEGLFISCVASEANLWAFILDGGTGFTCQVCQVSSVFLHKKWIMKQWENKYLITSIAGANNGSSLVVMSKGTSYTQQSYKVSDLFPYKWVNKKWKEGFHVTSMATSGSLWCVVASRNSGYSEQVVELDFLNPSEDIHRRLERGYMITSMAATADQAALILSIPKRKATDKIQETLRTSVFPSSYLKDKWAKNMYITSMCYGRTVC
ncbi:Casein kinase 1-like protein HD16 [Cardamine amara subsp. amara]|uniref:Casein kinase 1-like protein HD16 n=1 Tax=Cardamine amara subsp. amara TaxID=228776 RepID=A0ABD1B729_CARAN